MEGEKVKISYETLWKFIIRPPRDDYTEEMLGNPCIKYHHKRYIRKDYDIMSTEGHILKCSFIEPDRNYRPRFEMPVVVYLHGNSSSRMEGLRMAEELLKRNINLFIFDFAGCGLSEGEYISLGYHESKDVGVIIDFIEKLPGVGRIGLWGRSMGAATTMLYAHRDNRIKAICMDSPFADFRRLAKELTLKQINLPNFVLDATLSIVRGTILDKNNLDINELKPIKVAAITSQPAIFVHAIYDELINVQHSIDLFNEYGGPKSLKCCDKGGHNTKRHSNIINEIGEFFEKNLCVSDYNKNLKKANSSDIRDVNRFNNKVVNRNNIGNNIVTNRENLIEEEDIFEQNKINENIQYNMRKEQNEKRNRNQMEQLIKSININDFSNQFEEHNNNNNHNNNHNNNNNNNDNNRNNNRNNNSNNNNNGHNFYEYFNINKNNNNNFGNNKTFNNNMNNNINSNNINNNYNNFSNKNNSNIFPGNNNPNNFINSNFNNNAFNNNNNFFNNNNNNNNLFFNNFSNNNGNNNNNNNANNDNINSINLRGKIVKNIDNNNCYDFPKDLIE